MTAHDDRDSLIMTMIDARTNDKAAFSILAGEVDDPMYVAGALADAILASDWLRERDAEKWDEGEAAGQENVDDGYPDPLIENPYRQERGLDAQH